MSISILLHPGAIREVVCSDQEDAMNRAEHTSTIVEVNEEMRDFMYCIETQPVFEDVLRRTNTRTTEGCTLSTRELSACDWSIALLQPLTMVPPSMENGHQLQGVSGRRRKCNCISIDIWVLLGTGLYVLDAGHFHRVHRRLEHTLAAF